MNQQQKQKILAVVAILVLATFLFGDDEVQPQAHRSLSTARSFDPTSTEPQINTTSTLTVYLTPTPRPNPAYSIFLTDVLQRYGSGRFRFKIERHAHVDYSCKKPVVDNAPCLVVNRGRHYLPQHIKCYYPQCKTMISNDERCQVHGYDVREYYSATMPNTGYLPLGSGYEAWKSFQKIKSNPGFSIPLASKRTFAFNAIFSQSTNEGRAELAQLIEQQQEGSELPIFTTMAKKWYIDGASNPRREQLDTKSYMEVLLRSVFTLSPAGQNPECFRLFEAIEAGSIPVLVKNDLYITRMIHPCREALMHWYDAPILVLESWAELYPTVEKLMADREALDEMQIKLGTWYDKYMRKVVRDFEDFMMESYRSQEVSAEGPVLKVAEKHFLKVEKKPAQRLSFTMPRS